MLRCNSCFGSSANLKEISTDTTTYLYCLDCYVIQKEEPVVEKKDYRLFKCARCRGLLSKHTKGDIVTYKCALCGRESGVDDKTGYILGIHCTKCEMILGISKGKEVCVNCADGFEAKSGGRVCRRLNCKGVLEPETTPALATRWLKCPLCSSLEFVGGTLSTTSSVTTYTTFTKPSLEKRIDDVVDEVVFVVPEVYDLSGEEITFAGF